MLNALHKKTKNVIWIFFLEVVTPESDMNRSSLLYFLGIYAAPLKLFFLVMLVTCRIHMDHNVFDFRKLFFYLVMNSLSYIVGLLER